MERINRSQGKCKWIQLLLSSPLPERDPLLSVADNKLQLIALIIDYLIDHKDEEVLHSVIITGPEPVPIEVFNGVVIQRMDLRTTHEEADVIIPNQVCNIFSQISPCGHLFFLQYSKFLLICILCFSDGKTSSERQ